MKNKCMIKVGFTVLCTMMLSTLIACSNPTGGGGGGGGGTPVDTDTARVTSLPSFEGKPVSSEEEASTLATYSNLEIQTLSSQAQLQTPTQPASRSIYGLENGTFVYEYNGVKLVLTRNISDNYPDFPFTFDITELLTINGTYSGYKIVGTGLDFKYKTVYSSNNPLTYTTDYTYDCAYSVSKDEKGMKVLYNGTMHMSYNPLKYQYKLHYKIYDNNNKLLFNFDYNYEL